MSANIDSLSTQLLEDYGRGCHLNQLMQSFYESPKVSKLQEIIEYKFLKPENLFNASVHRSFANEVKSLGIQTNEKMEFLGDALLDAYVSIEICEKFADLEEGALSKLRGSIVREKTLAELALHFGLNETLLLGKGEVNRGGAQNKSSLADYFEALVTAVYYDSDINQAQSFLKNLLGKYPKELISKDMLDLFDAKTKLQEWTTKNFKCLPEYQSVEKSTNGKVSFEIKLNINGKHVNQLESTSKKKGEKELARIAWQKIKNKELNL